MRGEGLFFKKPGLSSRPSFKLSLVFPTQFWLRLGFDLPCFDTLSHWLCTLIWRPFWNPIFTFLLSTEGSRTILSIWSSLVSTPSWKLSASKAGWSKLVIMFLSIFLNQYLSIRTTSWQAVCSKMQRNISSLGKRVFFGSNFHERLGICVQDGCQNSIFVGFLWFCLFSH